MPAVAACHSGCNGTWEAALQSHIHIGSFDDGNVAVGEGPTMETSLLLPVLLPVLPVLRARRKCGGRCLPSQLTNYMTCLRARPFS